MTLDELVDVILEEVGRDNTTHAIEIGKAGYKNVNLYPAVHKMNQRDNIKDYISDFITQTIIKA